MLVRHIPEEKHVDHGSPMYPSQFSEILLELLVQLWLFCKTLRLALCLIGAALSHLYCFTGLGYLGSSRRAIEFSYSFISALKCQSQDYRSRNLFGAIWLHSREAAIACKCRLRSVAGAVVAWVSA